MNFRPYTSRRRSERNMSGRASLNVAIAAAILFACAAFLWLHFRGGSEQPGEDLQFAASIAKVGNVASLRLQVVDKKELNGKPEWHFQATAKTQNAMRLIFELDDRFDSFSEGNSFTGVQYEMHLSERGQKVQSIQRFTTTGKEPPPPGASATVVLPGTRDPLGIMQYLRSVNWDAM